MKRSKTVEVTTIMLTVGLAVSACDGIDDRTANNSYYGNSTAQSFNFNEEKKLRISCDKPEDFSLPECHDKRNLQATSSSPKVHSTLIMYPWFWGGYGGGYSSYRNYGPKNSSAGTYASARSALVGKGLASTYRAGAIPASTFSKFGSMGSAMGARSATASVSRGGFGSTGRAFAVGTSIGAVGS